MSQAPQRLYLTLAGEINANLVPKVFQAFSLASQGPAKDVHLLFQSYGGFINDGITIYNFLRNVPVNLTIYNGGYIASIAVLVFLAGKRRTAASNSTFMIHKTHNSPPTASTAARLREIVASIDADDARIESILRGHIDLPPEKWKTHSERDLNFTATEALDSGLIHEIGDFTPPFGCEVYNIQ